MNGPAFPSHGSMGEVAHEGMTLRDYFIAHAPAEPQPWFQPQVPEGPKGPVWDGEPRTSEERKELDGWQEGFLRIADIKQPRAKAFAIALDAHKKESAGHYKLVDRERYVQWPAAWADAMLLARAVHQGTEPTRS